MSGKLAERATATWTQAGLRRITLHECRQEGGWRFRARRYSGYARPSEMLGDALTRAAGEVDIEVDTAVSQPARATKKGHGTMPEEGLEPPTRGL
jgi:hypothetical protein